MTKVKFHGKLGRIFGRERNLAVNSVGEAIHAINILNGRRLYPWLLEQDKRGIKYKILINEKPFKTDLDLNNINNTFNTELVCKYEKLDSIDIVPVIEGAGDDILGIFTLILGVVLIATGIFAPAGASLGLFTMTAGLKAGFIIGGAALLAGGISSLLASPPKFEDFREIEKKAGRQSYLFSGPQNITQEGGPVPIGYGRLVVGSQVIASSYVISDTNARTDIGDIDDEWMADDRSVLAGYPIKTMIWGNNETILFSGSYVVKRQWIGGDSTTTFRALKIKTKSDNTEYGFSPKFSNSVSKKYIPNVAVNDVIIMERNDNDLNGQDYFAQSLFTNTNDVYALALTSDNMIYVGGGAELNRKCYNLDDFDTGKFTSIIYNRFAKVNGLITPYWKPTAIAVGTPTHGTNAAINALLVKKTTLVDRILAFGSFTSIVDSANRTNKDYNNSSVTVNRGMMVYNTSPYAHDGRVDATANFSCNITYNIFAAEFLSDEKILVGGSSSGTAIIEILTTTGASSGVSLPTFSGSTSGSNGCIYSIYKIDNTNFLIGGNFEKVSGTNIAGATITDEYRSGIIKITDVGTNDWRINENFDCRIFGTAASTYNVKTIYFQENEKIMVGGDFDRIGTIASFPLTDYNGIIRLLSTGAIDIDFKCAGGFKKNASPGTIYKILVSSNNKDIYVCGDYTDYKGEKTQASLLRLIGS